MAKKKQGEFRVVKCACCGRYEKTVDSRVVNWYCSDCSFGNGNYFRKVSGKEIILPRTNIKKNTIVTSIFGTKYKVLGIGYKHKNTIYYFVVDINSKDGIPQFLGDYQIIK